MLLRTRSKTMKRKHRFDTCIDEHYSSALNFRPDKQKLSSHFFRFSDVMNKIYWCQMAVLVRGLSNDIYFAAFIPLMLYALHKLLAFMPQMQNTLCKNFQRNSFIG